MLEALAVHAPHPVVIPGGVWEDGRTDGQAVLTGVVASSKLMKDSSPQAMTGSSQRLCQRSGTDLRGIQ